MNLPKHWSIESNSLVRTHQFPNFIEAVAFVNTLVPLAESLKHHPDVEIFSYNKVKIKLTTHDKQNTISEKDVELAQKINLLVNNRLSQRGCN